jgi:hypothetical protein
MATEDRHFTHSTLRERIVEHVLFATCFGHYGGTA